MIACGEGPLLPKLRQMKHVKRAEVERGGEPGLTQVLLTAEGESPVERELFTLLCAMQWPLLRLAPVEDSLEEIFLRATAN